MQAMNPLICQDIDTTTNKRRAKMRRPDFLTRPERHLSGQLIDKSRQRRQDLARQGAPSAARRARRNDVLPRLEIDYVAVGDLRPSAKKLRKADPGHVAEVAGSISALGFLRACPSWQEQRCTRRRGQDRSGEAAWPRANSMSAH